MLVSLGTSALVRQDNAQVFRAIHSHAVFADRQELVLLEVFVELREDRRHLTEGCDERSRHTGLSTEEDVSNASRNRLGVNRLSDVLSKIVRHVDVEASDVEPELEARH